MTPLTPGSADALLFDLGRVVLDIDFNRALALLGRSCRLRARAISSARFVARRHLSSVTRRGEIDDAEFFAGLRASLGIDVIRRAVPRRLERDLRRRNAGIAPLLARAAKRLPLYAFSNTNRAHVAHFSTAYADVLGHFREIFLSSTIGLRKPDAAAYDHVVKAIGVPAPRIVFFDDLAENIEGARARGLDRGSRDIAR